ncbi:hypothetical protein CBL_07710 [Carabus blaptoides fortunei]
MWEEYHTKTSLNDRFVQLLVVQSCKHSGIGGTQLPYGQDEQFVHRASSTQSVSPPPAANFTAQHTEENSLSTARSSIPSGFGDGGTRCLYSFVFIVKACCSIVRYNTNPPSHTTLPSLDGNLPDCYPFREQHQFSSKEHTQTQL